jgi:hypothetical protein
MYIYIGRKFGRQPGHLSLLPKLISIDQSRRILLWKLGQSPTSPQPKKQRNLNILSHKKGTER